MKDIKAFFTAIDDAPNKVATFLVPAAIRILITLWKKELIAVADKIDFVETGAAPLAATDMSYSVSCYLIVDFITRMLLQRQVSSLPMIITTVRILLAVWDTR